MLNNLNNMPYNFILQQETYDDSLEQVISLGKTLTYANDDQGLNSYPVTRILSGKMRTQWPSLYTGWRAATPKKSRLEVNYRFKFDEFSCTFVHLAVANGSYELLEALLKAGADVNAEDAHGKTSLHLAVISGNLKVVSLLLQAKADVNAQDQNGYTALQFAIVNGNWEAVIILLENSADIKALDQNAQSKLDALLKALLEEARTVTHLHETNITNVAEQTAHRQ